MTVRVIYDNAANTATLSASSSASASLSAANLLTDIKSEVLRSVGTSLTLTLTWTTSKTISGVVAAFSTLTPTATMRVRGYAETNSATPLRDTGTLDAVPGTPAVAPTTNTIAYGGSTYARLWFTPVSVKKLVIDISDPTNPSGYIDIGRLICGDYWSPEHNPTDTSLSSVDLSKQYRTEGGDLMTDVGPTHKKQSLNFGLLNSTDRTTIWNIVVKNGLSKPLFISFFPNDVDGDLEQAHQIYGKLVSTAAFTIPSLRKYATTLEQEEI